MLDLALHIKTHSQSTNRNLQSNFDFRIKERVRLNGYTGSEVQSGDWAFDLSQKWRQDVTRRNSDASK